jgi:hypothetical protein
MKKKVLTKKLVLSKKTVAALNYDEMNLMRGGVITEIGHTCYTDAKCCPNPVDSQPC